MTSVSEVQSLLRFLGTAKIPIPLAMAKIPALKEASLTTPESLSGAPLPALQSIFGDEKLAKQVLSTAKRASKKRTSSSTFEASQSPKKAKITPLNPGQELSPAEIEASLALPNLDHSKHDDIETALNETFLFTNRAPLVVAFVVQLTKYTMPTQPLSSRLSLAQAVMSMGAQAKALNLGIQSGRTAEEEGWGEGQPSVRIMGRKVPVMRRWGYDSRNKSQESADQDTMKREESGLEPCPTTETATAPSNPETDIESQETIKGDPSTPPDSASLNPQNNQDPTDSSYDPPLWALNLETLAKKSSYPSAPIRKTGLPNDLPIYDPNSARNYLLKSFATSTSASPPPPSPAKKAKSAALAREKEEKENNLARLLYALDLVFASWIDVIGPEELDRRTFSWYWRVRPSVEAGREGWGGKGDVKLADLLKLRR